MRKSIPILKILASLCPFICFAESSSLQSEEEVLFFNRIADFWEEKEYKIAKNQMAEFLKTYPDSLFSDAISAALGCLSLREKKPMEALEHYAKIKNAEIASAHFIHRMQCLYSLEWYAVLADECEAYLESRPKTSEEKEQVSYYLALALYNQCLNSPKESEAQNQHALRAKPYFEALLNGSKNPEIVLSFAHICCILKEFPKAVALYRELAVNQQKEDMLFQAALIESEYDKELAIHTFQEIIDMNGSKCALSAYNLLVLSFELKRHETLLAEREAFLEKLPEDKKAIGHLFFGKSLLALQKPIEACAEIQKYLDRTESFHDVEMQRSALLTMMDACFQARNIACFSASLEKMQALFPLDEEFLNGKFFKAALLVQSDQEQDAEKELLELMTLLDPLDHPLKPQVLMELSRICYSLEHWESCRNHARFFLSHFSSHVGAFEMGEYLLAASTRISQKDGSKEDLIADLNSLLSLESRSDWQLLLAKTYYSIQQYSKTISILEQTFEKPLSLTEEIERFLLLAVSYREEHKDLALFCKTAEKALKLLESVENPQKIADIGALHASLYNAYLSLSEKDQEAKALLLESAKTHLFAAFQQQATIELETLLWLAECYSKEEAKKNEAISILEHAIANYPKETLEKSILSLSRLYFQNSQEKKSIGLLEDLMAKYRTSPFLNWQYKNETALLLAEQYADYDQREKAFALLDFITKDKSSLKTETGALACLKSVHLKMEEWKNQALSKDNLEVERTLAQLKDLVLQKSLPLEPLYLEAALDYVNLCNQCAQEPEQKLFLLQKTKKDFEACEDLLSKDYHEARKQFPLKDAIYQSYLQFLEAEILAAQSLLKSDEEIQKQLQAKAKGILLKIVEEQTHPALVARANKCLYP